MDDFTADAAAGTVTCPAGITRHLTARNAVIFGAACRGCPLREKCTTAKDGRTLHLHEHDGLLRAARADWAADPGLREDYMTHRANVERAIAQVATWRGRRLKLRYRGQARNRDWLKRQTAAVNLRILLGRGLARRDGAWALAVLAPGQTASAQAPSAVAFSPDSKLLATIDDGGELRLWDVTDPAHPRPAGQPLPGSTAPVNSVAFSPGGRTLAAGGGHGPDSKGTLRLWDVTDPAHPRPASQPLPGSTVLTAVAFSPGGHTLAAGGREGTVRLWDVTDPAHPRPLGQPLPAGAAPCTRWRSARTGTCWPPPTSTGRSRSGTWTSSTPSSGFARQLEASHPGSGTSGRAPATIRSRHARRSWPTTTTRSDAAAPSGPRSGAPGPPAPTAQATPGPAAPMLSAALGDVADLKPPGPGPVPRPGHADRGLREYCRHKSTVLLANPPIHRNDAQLSPGQPQHRPQE